MRSGWATDGAKVEARVKKLLETDLNNDGLLDVDEFLAAGGTKEEFNKLDLDKDGLLDAHELTLLAQDKTMYKKVRSVSKRNQEAPEDLLPLDKLDEFGMPIDVTVTQELDEQVIAVWSNNQMLGAGEQL